MLEFIENLRQFWKHKVDERKKMHFKESLNFLEQCLVSLSLGGRVVSFYYMNSRIVVSENILSIGLRTYDSRLEFMRSIKCHKRFAKILRNEVEYQNKMHTFQINDQLSLEASNKKRYF